jgi:hypothetical protein
MTTEIIALSDTHLGDHASLLKDYDERWELCEFLRAFTGGCGGGLAEVETVVLMGDIVERCLATRQDLAAAACDFMDTLFHSFNIKELIYLPGNHDHTLWRDLARGLNKPYEVTPIDQPLKITPQSPAGQLDLAKIFFNYPKGSLCRDPSGDPARARLPTTFRVGNPFYHKVVNDRSYLFTHGTYWRWDVARPAGSAILDLVDQTVLGHEVERTQDPYQARDLSDLEARTYAFVDSMWSNEEDKDMSRKELVWFLLSNLSSLFQERKGPAGHCVFKNGGAGMRVSDQVPYDPADQERTVRDFTRGGHPDGATQRLLKYVRECFRVFPEFQGLRPDITLVYGDTHDSGYQELESIKPNGRPMRVYNTGAWISHSRLYHPPGFIFAVKDGQEFMLELAHDKGALEKASRDSEVLWESLGAVEKRIVKFMHKALYNR